MPGVHIEIKDPSLSKIYKPDYFLVLARNYIDSILDQEKELYEE
jgi:hypothetical protein